MPVLACIAPGIHNNMQQSQSELVQVELIEPPASASLGERVTAQGYEAEPDEQLNPKKKASTQRTVSVSSQS